MTTDWGPKDDKLKTMWLVDGMSSTQIAKFFGVSRNAVIGRIHRNGWSRPRPGDLKRIATRLALKAERTVMPPRAPDPPPRPRATFRPPVLIEPLPLEKPDPRPGKVIPLERLSHATCRWPFGTPGTPSFGFCGKPPEDGKPYCAAHVALAYVPPAQKRKHRRKAA